MNDAIAVFCGSHHGTDIVYAETAVALGRELARRGLTAVTGGGRVGLMGTVADTVLAVGGEVVGVIPRALNLPGVAHEGLTRLEVVADMHARKAYIMSIVDGFIALPGGIGTYEEILEALTWAQLGYHHKPCALLDAGGFYARLVEFLDQAVERGFFKPAHREMLIIERDPAVILDRFAAYEPPREVKWGGLK